MSESSTMQKKSVQIQPLPLHKSSLEGKVVIVTGASSGIGEASARLFAYNGALAVVIADIQDQLGHEVAASIGLDHAAYFHCDVTDEEQVKSLVDWTVKTYGRLDVMFSNAGAVSKLESILELDLNTLDTILSVNVRGMAAAIKHAARAMVGGGIKGSIICTASVTATLGGAAGHVYTISKHAVLGLVRSACSELGKHGIRVNCVSPFGVATPLLCGALQLEPAVVEAWCASICNLQGVVLKAKDVADAALFLASDDSAFISGHNLVVDGGFSVVNHDLKVFK